MSGDSLETRLRRLYEVSIPDRLVLELDRRTSAAVAAAVMRLGAAEAHRQGRRRRLVAVAIAAVLVTVAATPVIRFFDGWGQPFDRVFELSTLIEQSVTDDAYHVTMVRAYADPSTVRLAITAEDLEDRGWAEINVTGASVRDAAGRTYPMAEGMFRQLSPESSESWLRFRVPDDDGAEAERRLFVDVDRISVRPDPAPTLANGEIDLDHVWTSVQGKWSFEFDLPFFVAQTATPGVAAAVSGIMVIFEELTVTPAATVGRLTFSGLPEVPPDWAWDPNIRVEHDGEALDVGMLDPGSVTDQLIFEADPGFKDLGGTWVITIDEFHRDVPDPSSDVTTEEESIKGPWVLTFEGPATVAP